MSELLKFAKRLEKKLAQSKKTTTTELFFGDESSRDLYISKIESSAKIQEALKKENIAFSLYAFADASNAYWDLKVTPDGSKSKIYGILNEEYVKIFNMSMLSRAKEVLDMIKKGIAGSGKLRVVDYYQDLNQL